MKVLYWFLTLVPVALVAHIVELPPTFVFILSGAALIPLAGLLGEATEELASHLGDRWGGFLNATFGNLGELIIAFAALRAGEIELVQLSIVGSIIGNIFLVLGLSLVVGGIRHGKLTFSQEAVGPMISLLFLPLTAMLIPTIAHAARAGDAIEHRGVIVGIVLLVLYALFLFFRFKEPKDEAVLNVADIHETTGFRWSKWTALVILAVAAVGVTVMSEILVHHVDLAGQSLGWSKFFIGLFVIPLVGNVAEHFVAIQAAAKNRMDFSLEISVGSATQIALFVFPLLLLAGPIVGQTFTLVFPWLAIEAIGFSIMAAWLCTQDGKSNWLEGALLLGVCALLAICCF